MAFAKEFATEKIRNLAVLGHGGSGKTALIDALCFVSGTSKRHGDPAEGHALTMHTPEEAAHQISIQLTPAFAEHDDHKINFLDTPGYLDFTGEALSAVRVADSALIVVGAASGVEVGTERVWEYCEARALPRLLFVSMMDKEHADFERAYQEIKEKLTNKAVPVQIPIGEGEEFRGIVNLLTEKAHIFKKGTPNGAFEEGEVPGELREQFNEYKTELQETLATADEALLDKYLEQGHISRDEAIDALHRLMGQGEVCPLFCGSARLTYGMRTLLTEIVEVCPRPSEARSEHAARPGIDQQVELSASDDGPLAALVFKTTTEPHVGELSFFKVMSGSVENGMEILNAVNQESEKLGHLSVPLGKERLEVARLHAGDIGVVAKLKHTHTNDTLCSKDRPLRLAAVEFPDPDIAIAIRGVSRNDEDKLGEVLQRLHEEDSTFTAEFNSELHQTIARGLGELHLDIQIERMKRKYNVSVETEAPKIAYRETIAGTGEGQGRFKKQTGGRGQFGDCWIRFKPLPRGGGYEFKDAIKGGVIPGKFIPSVNKGIQEAALKGILAGYPLVDFTAECFDGSFHTVDSSDIAFQLAASLAFNKVVPQARPVLLEPVMEVSVTTPDEYVGDIMGDLTQRRGKVSGMEPRDERTVIRALVPEAELYKYSAALRAMTQGRAYHTRTLASYEQVPDQEAQKVIADRKQEKEGAQHA